MTIQQDFLDHTASYRLDIQCLMTGDLDSEIVLIGEYPGQKEVATGKPFNGGSGDLLWNCLRKFKIIRPHCYQTNVIKRQVTANDGCDLQELELWQEALHYELTHLTNAKVIVCLGNTAMSTLLGFEGITEHRGSVYEYKGIPVICAYNPAYCLRMPETEIIFAMDMEKMTRVLRGDYVPHIIKSVINPTFSEAMAYMRWIRKHKKRVSVDIEVTAMETACFGIAHSPFQGMCINFRDKDSNRFTLEEEFRLTKMIAHVVDECDTVAQNGNFDSYFCGFKDQMNFQVNFDTLLAHHTLYPRLPHNLGFLVSQYTDHPYYKDEKDVFREGGDIDNFWRYNVKDCCLTFAVALKEEQELRDQQLYNFFKNHVMRLQPHLSKATSTGIAIDPEVKSRLSSTLKADLEVLLQSVVNASRSATKDPKYSFNPSSTKQVQKLFFEDIGVKYHRKSLDRKARDDIAKDPRTSVEVKDLIARLNKFAEEKKFFSTYVQSKVDEDNRFRSEFKQYGVSKAPGRLSSGKVLWGSGGNAQNQPHRAFEMYVADNGCVWIYFDLAQAEARYVAWDYNIESWISDFERARLEGGFDAHRSLASTMFKIPYDDVPKEDWLDAAGLAPKHPDCDLSTLTFTKRFVAKRCRHGLNYRMHIARLAETTGMSYPQAASNYYTYHRTTPELQIGWQRVESTIRKKRMLFNSYGRRFITLERLENSDIMDSIIAFRPQSTIGDKTQRVWYQCHEDDKWDMNKARIALNVHDALYGIATPEYAMTALSIMKKYAEEPIMVKSIVTNEVRPMIIPADMKISNTEINDNYRRMSDLIDVDVEMAA